MTKPEISVVEKYGPLDLRLHSEADVIAIREAWAKVESTLPPDRVKIDLPPESPYSERSEYMADRMLDYFFELYQAGKSWPPKDA
ncbi:MAG TPA: hypothetical protein VGF71_10355 [Caulobacteraceae bacterium]|jgi:hypothetical protein